ncbi:MAG: hypothetical protein LRY71_18310 [Bacillaceae bacterium]|nr:hypothetical protein [Bacillaceae bacterium]
MFLTPNGALPVDVGDWYAITHSYVIEKGLELLTKNINAVPKENLKRFLLDLAIGPYEVTEEVLDEMIILAKQLKEEFALKKAVRFNQLLTDNRLLINVLMEEKIND